VLSIRTEDIYLAAGLDAVVMLKTIEYGVQLFVPLAVVSLAVRTHLVLADTRIHLNTKRELVCSISLRLMNIVLA
jgi:hypothetical protein